jgi:PmbA protein
MMRSDDLLHIARRAVEQARAAGAQEAVASASRGVSVELSQREGLLEQATESRSASLGIRLLVDERYSSHGTSDLRPEAVAVFIQRAVAASRLLEPDPDRALPPAEACGLAEGVELDSYSEAQEALASPERRALVAALEAAVLARRERAALRSTTAYAGDSRSVSAVVFSNGFEGSSASTSFGYGATITLEEPGGKLPEASTGYSASHAEDLPDLDAVAEDAWERALRRLDSRPVPSGRYPMLLENRAVGRILGMLLGPMSGSALHYGRSCLAGKLGKRVAAEGFQLLDDPHIVRGAGSRRFDADGFPTARRVLVRDGVLQCYLLNQYFARKLDMAATTGGTSNLVIPPGSRSPHAIATDLPRAIRVESFLGGNANSTTGDFSFGIRGTLLERGEPAQSVSEMNIAGNLFELYERYREAADDVRRYGTSRVPSVLFDDVQFSGV